MMPAYIFDCHCHFSFKPANSKNYVTRELPDPDHYRERIRNREQFHWLAQFSDKTVIKSSQLNGDSCTSGVHRVICNGLYPLERGFISGVFLGPLGTLTGYDTQVLQDLKDYRVSYYEMTVNEFENLKANAGKNGQNYAVVEDFAAIKSNLRQDPDKINILNSTEGMHSFTSDVMHQGVPANLLAAEKRHIRLLASLGSGDPIFLEFLRQLRANLESVKDWSPPPFYITLSHHYYNHIAGHSPSLTGFVDLIGDQDGATIDPGGEILNFFYVGIHGWGYDLIDQALSRDNGKRRILIDVKHMSPQARLDYYDYLRVLKKRNPHDHIPIIKSHTAVSGRFNMTDTVRNSHNLFKKEKKRSRYFYNGVINLFDNEILEIVNSDGIMGLMIDERRIMGRNVTPESGFNQKKEFKKVSKKSGRRIGKIIKTKHQLQWLNDDLAQKPGNIEIIAKINKCKVDLAQAEQEYQQFALELKPAYLSVLFRQIFHILDLTGEKGWDHICIGTDYDGVVNPIDTYKQSADMAHLEDDLVNFWEQMRNHPYLGDRYSEHVYSSHPRRYVQKILCLNGLNFLKKYYSEAYLRNGHSAQRGWALTATEEVLFLSANMS